METRKNETEWLEIVEYSNFSTVGELKEILSKFPDEMNFGFRNQPFQNLQHLKYKDENFECLVFVEPAEECLNYEPGFLIEEIVGNEITKATITEVSIVPKE